jgi:rhodanese-related sulfurtransferase
MRRHLRLMGLGVVLALVVAKASGETESVSSAISPDALLDRLERARAPLILDVRTPGEYHSGHIPGAINLPHSALPQRLAELASARDQEVVVYCEVGARASVAQAILRRAGFSTVRHLEGDMRAWRGRGLPCSEC